MAANTFSDPYLLFIITIKLLCCEKVHNLKLLNIKLIVGLKNVKKKKAKITCKWSGIMNFLLHIFSPPFLFFHLSDLLLTCQNWLCQICQNQPNINKKINKND